MKLLKTGGIILLIVVILAAAGLGVASATGAVNLQAVISRLPLIGAASGGSPTHPPDGYPGADAATYNSLKLENGRLKQQVASLTQQLALMQGSQPGSAAGSANKKSGIATQSLTTDQASTFKDLAGYYAGMKPAAAVAILSNLDPQMTAGILHEMDKEEAGQILAGMDPAQAAKVIKLIAGLGNTDGSQHGNQGTGATP
jgi:flagellar motility protein MotE (MotC chaperone)